MKLYEQIRRAHEREDTSIRALAREFGVHRRDVRAALESPIPPAREPVAPRPAPKMDRYKKVVDGWLETDRKMPRKQRHTARRVWQRLVDEHGADVGESTVRRYVACVRARQEAPLVEVKVPQDHRLGEEAEVDFGSIHVYLDGLLAEVALFVMRLSASGRSYPRAYLTESQEVFLDGHVRAFDHFGGFPARVRHDNLKAAVVKVLKGRSRIESDRFIALRSHYGFDSFFCIPGIEGAHEKGGVEGEIGRFRRRHLVPIPKVGSMTELNDLLIAGAVADDARHIGSRHATVGDHFALEAPRLRPLPAEGYDATILGRHRVDTKSRVCVRGAHYSVPVRYVRHRLDVRVGAEVVEVLDGAKTVASHRRARKGDEVLALDHYLEVLEVKPGALPSATALVRARANGAFADTHQRFWDQARRTLGDRDGTRALIGVLLIHRRLPAHAVTAGITRALRAGSVDPVVVEVEARRAHDESQAPAPVIPIGTHNAYDRPEPTLTSYDTLLEAQ